MTKQASEGQGNERGDEGAPGSGKVGAIRGTTRVVVHNAKHLAGKAKGKLGGTGK